MSASSENAKQLKRLKGRIETYRSQTAYVKDARRLNRMREYLAQAQEFLDQGDVVQSSDALYQAKREFILARIDGEIYYFRSSRGMLLAAILVIVFSLGILALWLVQDPQVSRLVASLGILETDDILSIIAPFLAALGGGVGGCTAVLIQAIDVDPESEVVSKTQWYGIKPVLGAALGLISYLAIASGLGVIATGATVNNFAGAVVIGFLAGFFESFSTGILARIAAQFTQSKEEGEAKDTEEGKDQPTVQATPSMPSAEVTGRGDRSPGGDSGS